jgi:hypothetical protein
MLFKRFILIPLVIAFLAQTVLFMLSDDDFEEDLNPSPPATNDWDN